MKWQRSGNRNRMESVASKGEFDEKMKRWGMIVDFERQQRRCQSVVATKWPLTSWDRIGFRSRVPPLHLPRRRIGSSFEAIRFDAFLVDKIW